MRRCCRAHNASGSSTCWTRSPSTSEPARSRIGRRQRLPRRSGWRRRRNDSRPPSASTTRFARWRSRSTWPHRTPRPGARSGGCWPPTAARWSSIAPTRPCVRRSLSNQPGRICASCGPRSRVAGPSSARPSREAPRPPSTPARSINRPRSGSTSGIRSAWAVISWNRRWPSHQASWPPRCRSTRSVARCRKRRSTPSTTTVPGCGR